MVTQVTCHMGRLSSKVHNKCKDKLLILAANLWGFWTNIGELTHSFILKEDIDIVATVKTFLDDTVEESFGKIPGYTHWFRRDRISGHGGAIAVCHREALQVQHLEINVPDWMEVMFFRITMEDSSALLLCVMYRLQCQGGDPLLYLTEHLDDMQS